MWIAFRVNVPYVLLIWADSTTATTLLTHWLRVGCLHSLFQKMGRARAQLSSVGAAVECTRSSCHKMKERGIPLDWGADMMATTS